MRLFKQKQDPKICEAVPFIFNRARTMKGSKDYKRQVRNIAEQLREFEQSRGIVLYSNSLTTEMCDDLYDFLSSKNLLENTVSGTMSKMFTHFRTMRRNGYTVNSSFEDYKLKTESVMTVSLTVDEIKRLYGLKTRNSLVRDLFVVGCFTGMRYSDFSTLTDKNISGNSIVKKTRKTGVHVEVPIHPIVREILERYNGFPPPYRDTYV